MNLVTGLLSGRVSNRIEDPIVNDQVYQMMREIFPNRWAAKLLATKRNNFDEHKCDSLGCCPWEIYFTREEDQQIQTANVWPLLTKDDENPEGKIIYLFLNRADRDSDIIDVSKSAVTIKMENRFMVHEYYGRDRNPSNDNLHLFVNNTVFKCTNNLQLLNWIYAIIDKDFPPNSTDRKLKQEKNEKGNNDNNNKNKDHKEAKEHKDFRSVKMEKGRTKHGIEYNFSTCGIYNSSSSLLLNDFKEEQVTPDGIWTMMPANSCLIKKSKYGWEIEANSSQYRFPTVRCNVNAAPPRKDNNNHDNKYYYEVNLQSDGLLQIGICTNEMRLDESDVNINGTGDNKFSWGIDLYRLQAWHNGKGQVYGGSKTKKWKKRDRLGVGLNLDENCIEFWLNNVSLGAAFGNINKDSKNNSNINLVYMPCISMSSKTNGNKVEIIFDRKHFYYGIPKGYKTFITADGGYNNIYRDINLCETKQVAIEEKSNINQEADEKGIVLSFVNRDWLDGRGCNWNNDYRVMVRLTGVDKHINSIHANDQKVENETKSNAISKDNTDNKDNKDNSDKSGIKGNTDNNMDNKKEKKIALDNLNDIWKTAASHMVLNEIVAEIHKKNNKK